MREGLLLPMDMAERLYFWRVCVEDIYDRSDWPCLTGVLLPTTFVFDFAFGNAHCLRRVTTCVDGFYY